MIWKTAEPTTKKSSRPTTRGPYFKPPSSCEHTFAAMRLLTQARDNTLCFTHLLLLVKTAPGDALSVLLGPQALSTRNARATEHVAGVALKRKESDASKKQTKNRKVQERDALEDSCSSKPALQVTPYLPSRGRGAGLLHSGGNGCFVAHGCAGVRGVWSLDTLRKIPNERNTE